MQVEGDTEHITPEAMHKEGYAAQIEDDFLLSENNTRRFSGKSKLEMIAVMLHPGGGSMATIVVVNKHR